MQFSELYHIAKAALEELSTLEEPDFRLEQAEYNEEKEEWEVVVSFLVENHNGLEAPLAATLASKYKYQRTYKKVRIDKNRNVLGFYMYSMS